MPSLRNTSMLVAALALAACVPSRRSAPGPTPIVSLTGTAHQIQLTGSFRATMSAAAGEMAPGTEPRVDGTVNVSSQGYSTSDWAVHLDFTSERGSEMLLWTIVPGSCGSPNIPLISPSDNPQIYVANSGHGRLDADFRNTLDPRQDYHVNLYANYGTGLANVVACADLHQRRE